jgi:hypothetical protein
MSSSDWIIIPNLVGENKTCSKPPTSHGPPKNVVDETDETDETCGNRICSKVLVDICEIENVVNDYTDPKNKAFHLYPFQAPQTVRHAVGVACDTSVACKALVLVLLAVFQKDLLR